MLEIWPDCDEGTEDPVDCDAEGLKAEESDVAEGDDRAAVVAKDEDCMVIETYWNFIM